MMHRALPWLCLLALFACKPDSESVGNGGSGNASGSGSGAEDSSGSGSASQGSASMTSAGPGGDPTTEGTTGGPTTDITETLPMTTPVNDSSGSGDPGACDIVEVVNDAAFGKMEPIDCGFVHLADPLAAWQAAHDCVLDNYDSSQAFTLVAEQQGIDSEVHEGFAGTQGEVYMAFHFVSDSGGVVAGTIITGGECMIEAVADCTVAQGNLCLTCSAAHNPMTVCESS